MDETKPFVRWGSCLVLNWSHRTSCTCRTEEKAEPKKEADAATGKESEKTGGAGDSAKDAPKDEKPSGGEEKMEL